MIWEGLAVNHRDALLLYIRRFYAGLVRRAALVFLTDKTTITMSDSEDTWPNFVLGFSF